MFYILLLHIPRFVLCIIKLVAHSVRHISASGRHHNSNISSSGLILLTVYDTIAVCMTWSCHVFHVPCFSLRSYCCSLFSSAYFLFSLRPNLAQYPYKFYWNCWTFFKHQFCIKDAVTTWLLTRGNWFLVNTLVLMWRISSWPKLLNCASGGF